MLENNNVITYNFLIYFQRSGFSWHISNGLKPNSIITSWALKIGSKVLQAIKHVNKTVTDKNAMCKKSLILSTPPYYIFFCFIFNLEPCRLWKTLISIKV